jgi:hypothetical protein
MANSPIPLYHGVPITPGWWWLRFADGPGPRHWDGTFWDRGSYFATAEDYAEFPIIGPCPVPENKVKKLLFCEGPRPTLAELALDDLKVLLAIVQQHEPGSYRASGTIAKLQATISK